ncbi:MAG: hypothetical protein JKX72_09365 [Robiginitomaculum sp.]|nr:hypothetical protein [Robiginitomaculum sp.]
MTLENTYYIGQTVAVVAILATLIALIIQMRNANKLTRKAAIQNQLDGLERGTRALFEIPGLADIYYRAFQGEAALTDGERVIFRSYNISILRIWEALHAQYMEGEINQELWENHCKQLSDPALSLGVREVWRYQRRMVSEQFRVFLDEVFAKVEPVTKAKPGTVHADGAVYDPVSDAVSNFGDNKEETP